MLLHLRFKLKFIEKFSVFKSAEYHFQDSRENKSRLQFTNLYYVLCEHSDSLDIHVDDFYGLNYEDWIVFFIKIFVCIIIISVKMRYVEKLTNQSGSKSAIYIAELAIY